MSHGGHSRAWSDEEAGIVLDTLDRPAREVAEIVHRSVGAVEKFRSKIKKGWSRERVEWTPIEDETLVANRHKNNSEMRLLLPGRSLNAIQARRRIVGVSGCRQNASPFEVGKRRLLAKTCRECGYLLPGERFMKNRNSGKASYCRNCYSKRMVLTQKANPEKYSKTSEARAEYTAKFRRRMQQLTQANATRNGYPYLESDYEVLADPTLTILGKALRVQRSWIAVASACGNRGYKSRGPVAGKSADHAWLIDNPNVDRIDEITASLKQEFETVGVPFPAWDWDDEDLKETAA